MPILATGNRSLHSDAGFSLTELLAVLAILSLMVGAVVLNLPSPRSQTDKRSEAMAAQMTQFIRDGSLRGDVRAFGMDAQGLTLFRHDGLTWSRVEDLAWPQEARVQLENNGDRVDLPERAIPQYLIEPYGAVPDVALILQAQDGEYRLETNDHGHIIRTVVR